ncbi:CapA family protein [Cohnella sp. GbtcB17]|uniref:CapA family protein n=1 Tax=Cohnella sp. GbtcB17 TaxID=2824762 RepID=UPI001C310EDC|nr:CapA family protein [Cohnella sp. GbtcB17]
MPTIRIAAVGDLMVKRYIISDAKSADGAYNFDPLLEKVAPLLQEADLTIGNLETTFAGKTDGVRRRSHGPLFNCPDELAPALKKAGFDVLITANNHCMDHGSAGLLRTLRVLDRCEIGHTGTFSSAAASREALVRDVKGVRVGILSYTSGLNGIPLPPGRSWMVNLIRPPKMIEDMRRLKKRADLVVVCMHFGQEYTHVPNKKQRQLVDLLFRHGAHIVLGSHSHVLQPLRARGRRQFAAYSLGNFISTKLKENIHTQCGVVLNIDVVKNDNGTVAIAKTAAVPTVVRRVPAGQRFRTEVLPLRDALREGASDEAVRKAYRSMRNRASKIIGRSLA